MSTDDILFFTIIYGAGIAVLLFVGQTLKLAGNTMGGQGPQTAKTLVTGLWIWAVIANIYTLLIGNNIIWLLPSLFIPMLIVMGSTFTSRVAELLQHVKIHRLVGVQIYRIVGALFLVSYFVYDSYLSREFAMNAGWGDVLTGVLAIPVAWMAFKRVSLWPIAVIAWCILGIGDLILAPATAQLYGGPQTDDFPINAIPVFFGPPLGIILHLFTLRVLWLQSRPNLAPQVSGGEA